MQCCIKSLTGAVSAVKHCLLIIDSCLDLFLPFVMLCSRSEVVHCMTFKLQLTIRDRGSHRCQKAGLYLECSGRGCNGRAGGLGDGSPQWGPGAEPWWGSGAKPPEAIGTM